MNHLDIEINWDYVASMLQFKSSDDDDHRRHICCEIRRQLGKRGYEIFEIWMKSEDNYTPDIVNEIWGDYSVVNNVPHFECAANSIVHGIITAPDISSQLDKIVLIYTYCHAIRYLRKLHNPPSKDSDLSQWLAIFDAFKKISRVELMVRKEVEAMDKSGLAIRELGHQSPDSTEPVILH